MNVSQWPAIGLGFLLALIVLIVVIVFAISGGALTRDWLLILFGALAVARMLP